MQNGIEEIELKCASHEYTIPVSGDLITGIRTQGAGFSCVRFLPLETAGQAGEVLSFVSS